MRPARCLVPAALALTVGACGGGSSSPSEGEDVSAKSPEAILAGAADAVRQVHSFHMKGRARDHGVQETLEGDVTAEDELHLRLSMGSQRAEIVVADGRTYMRANDAFWNDSGVSGESRRRLADRWVIAPPEAAFGANDFLPKRLAHCLTTQHGRVTSEGVRMYEGQRVVVLADAGRPGDAPSELYIAASGRPLPVRERQTGPTPPGHPPKRDPQCSTDDRGTTESDIRITDYDKTVDISAPSGAVEMQSLMAPGDVS